MSFKNIPDIKNDTFYDGFYYVGSENININENTLGCSIKKWDLISNNKSIIFVNDYSYYGRRSHTYGTITFKMKACADVNCNFFVESNLINFVFYCKSSTFIPTNNYSWPASDNSITPWT
jgi:hypothetical protein